MQIPVCRQGCWKDSGTGSLPVVTEFDITHMSMKSGGCTHKGTGLNPSPMWRKGSCWCGCRGKFRGRKQLVLLPEGLSCTGRLG